MFLKNDSKPEEKCDPNDFYIELGPTNPETCLIEDMQVLNWAKVSQVPGQALIYADPGSITPNENHANITFGDLDKEDAELFCLALMVHKCWLQLSLILVDVPLVFVIWSDEIYKKEWYLI